MEKKNKKQKKSRMERILKDQLGDKKERKTEMNFIMLVIFVFGLLAVIILGIKVYTKPEIVSIDDLHKQNIEGKLDPDKGYMFNGFSFVYSNGMWFTKIRKLDANEIFNVQLHYGPKETLNISVDGDIRQFSTINGTYITFDPLGADLSHVALSASELSINLAVFFKMYVVAACTKNETDICKKREIVNCENNNKNPVVYIEEAAKTRIIQQKNCIRIQGNGFELVRAVDRLLYEWMNVING